MAKVTEKKKNQKKKTTASANTRTVKNKDTRNGADEKKSHGTVTVTTKRPEPKPDKPREREEKPERAPRVPSEHWNLVMPFVLCTIAVFVALFYIFILAEKIKSGSADAGAVGNFLNNLLIWLLGWSAYMIPAGLVVMAIRWRGITARGKCHGGLWVQFILVLILSSAVYELLFGELLAIKDVPVSDIWNQYAQALKVFSAEQSIMTGGAVGGVLAIGMRWALTKIPSAVLLIVFDLVMIALFVGLTPTVIVRFSKECKEARLRRRAERLQEFEEAHKAQTEAAKAERAARAEQKEREKQLKREAAAAQSLRKREEKQRAEEEKKREDASDLEKRVPEKPVEEKASQEAKKAPASIDTEDLAPPAAKDTDEKKPPEFEEKKSEEQKKEESAPEAFADTSDNESEKKVDLADDEDVGETSEEDGEDIADESVVIEKLTEKDAGEEDEDDDEPLMERTNPPHPLATDLDFGLNETTAKQPRASLPGDDELFGSFGYGAKRDPERIDRVAGAPAAESSGDEEIAEIEEISDDLDVFDGLEPIGEPEAKPEPEPELPPEPEYFYPPTSLLAEGKPSMDASEFADEIEAKKEELAAVLSSFGVRFRSIEFSRGPTITRYEIQPEPGQRVKAIQNLMDDIALSMAVSGVRFEPSIQGKAAVGIEVPNTTRETVTLRSLVESETFTSEKSKLTACLGADITGKPVVFDVSKMPHLLVAGATGMGKSVCINSIIVSLMYKAKPEEVRLILVDPKKVEFAMYRDMPHLLTPIITDPQKAAGALCSAVSEMEKRFELIERVGARDIAGYKKVTAGDPDMPRMFHIVIIIDELADLMMTASNDVEAAIMRIAQKARAAGIHLIIGTQRPSVDVITGTIKANIPSRIACTVASQTDSRTILDSQGAEKLCGRGDMLFAPVGASRPRRVQGSFVSEDEVVRVVNFMINNNGTALYDQQFMENINIEAERCMTSKKASAETAMVAECDEDPKLNDAIELAIESGKISTSLMQRRLEVGYGRAAKIIDRMEELGIVSSADGNKPRQVLLTMEEYLARCAAGNNDEDDEDDPF